MPLPPPHPKELPTGGVFGTNLRRVRRSMGQTQRQFAVAIGVAQADVSKWERNLRVPSVRTVQRIALILKLPLNLFLDGSAPIAPTESERRAAAEAAKPTRPSGKRK